MPAFDLRQIFRKAWQRAKESERVTDDDPVAEHVQESVVRTIAELEVRRLQRAQLSPVIPINGAAVRSEEKNEKEDDPKVSAVA
jgi:hypothetical protein